MINRRLSTRSVHSLAAVALLFLLGATCHGFLIRSSSSSSSSTTASPTALSVSSQMKKPGTAKLDVPWEDLGFEFRPTNSYLKMMYRDRAWQSPELVHDSDHLSLHIGATALHYGQSCFEGLKAFCHADNTVHVFRPSSNAARMQSSCARTLMPPLPTETFCDAVNMVVRDNIEYVPPAGSNGALYIRPLLFGSGPRIGLQPADEYTFLIMVIPVGDYYAGGLAQPVKGTIITEFDRAAPRGVGNVKVAGNYAADLLPNSQSKQAGYQIGLYLDAATQSWVEEFSTSNFVGIRDNTYVTPKSGSVLPSITNQALMQIAKDQGMIVEERDVPVAELAEFDEVLAVGTAVVVTPVGSIATTEQVYTYDTSNIGPVTQQLYDKVRAIQNGQAKDVYGWNVLVE